MEKSIDISSLFSLASRSYERYTGKPASIKFLIAVLDKNSIRKEFEEWESGVEKSPFELQELIAAKMGLKQSVA